MEAALLSGTPYRPGIAARRRAGTPERQLQGAAPAGWQQRDPVLLPPDPHQEALRHAAGLLPEPARSHHRPPAAAGDPGRRGAGAGDPPRPQTRPAGRRTAARHSAAASSSGAAGGVLSPRRAGPCERRP
ncbi:hypothetical protein ACE1BS_04735 [Aeromonas jandaei]